MIEKEEEIKYSPEESMGLNADFFRKWTGSKEKIRRIIDKFEKDTGRIVNNISLNKIDVTTICDANSDFIKEIIIDFLPKKSEKEEI